jgi:hypothetical protein
MRVKKFKLGKGCNVSSIALRETCGKDEEQAARAADAKGNRPGAMTEELLRLSIVEVDEKRTEYPYLGLAKWNTKTRNTVLTYFQSMNAVDDEETTRFLEEAEDCGEWMQASASSAGSTSSSG